MSRPNGSSMQQGGSSVRPPRQLVQPGPGQPPGIQPAQYQGASEPYGQQAYQNPQAPAQRPQAGYPPQNDPYAAQQGYAQPGQYYNPAPAQQQAYTQQPDQSHFQAGTDVRNLQRGAQYDQWQNAPPAHDSRGYDMGGYATAPQAAPVQDTQAHRYHPASGPSLSHGAQGHEWVAQNSAASTYAQAGHEPSLDTQGYQHDQQYAQAAEGSDQQQDYAAEEGDYEYEEAPRGRGMKIAAALVGAVVIGGGLAYAYTTIIGPGSNGKPPIIKSASGPSKIKPAEPGGKQFAHTDSKIMGRLGDNSGSNETDATGAKKVTTLTVGPDGAIKPPAASDGAPAAKAAADDVGFPATGTTLGAVKADIADSAAAVTQAADKPVVVTPPSPDKAVVVADAAAIAAKTANAPVTTQSIAQPAAPAKPAAAAAPAQPAKPVAVAAVAPAVKKAAAPAAAAVAAPVTTTGAGFVAVLASVPASATSRISALKQFADMQQKYGSVLQNKMPDVKEANLGEKGTYHRLLVGPPGSRDAANAVCGQLKSAGYTESCWVTAY